MLENVTGSADESYKVPIFIFKFGSRIHPFFETFDDLLALKSGIFRIKVQTLLEIGIV